jgi:hypothetical protein
MLSTGLTSCDFENLATGHVVNEEPFTIYLWQCSFTCHPSQVFSNFPPLVLAPDTSIDFTLHTETSDPYLLTTTSMKLLGCITLTAGPPANVTYNVYIPKSMIPVQACINAKDIYQYPWR